MKTEEVLSFISVLEKLKNVTRHSWTSANRHESVAEHSWRLTAIILLLKNKFKNYDINKMIFMAIFHDLGESKFGDIPGFNKTKTDEDVEDKVLEDIAEEYKNIETVSEIISVVQEFNKQESPESKLVRALDKLEAIIQHNEASIDTWLELEYDLNLKYGEDECKIEEITDSLRKSSKNVTVNKIRKKRGTHT